MIRSFVDSLLRHIVTAIGGSQFAISYWDGALSDSVTGVVLVLSGLFMSWIDKSKTSAKLKTMPPRKEFN